MVYSKEKKLEIINLIKEGKKTSEIVSITGVSKSTIYRIKRSRKEMVVKLKNYRNTLKNINTYDEVKKVADELLQDKMLTPGAKADVQISLIKMAIREKRYDEAKKIASEMSIDENISEWTKAVAKMQLIKIAEIEEDYDEANQIYNAIFSNEKLSLGQKTNLARQLIKITTVFGRHNQAREIANTLLLDDKIPEIQKTMTQEQLIKLAISEKSYEEAKRMASEMLQDKNLSEGRKMVTQCQLIRTTKGVENKQEKYEEAKKMANTILSNKEISAGRRIIVTSQLIRLAMEAKKFDDAREMANEMLQDEGLSDGQKEIIHSQLIKLEKIEEKHKKNNDNTQKTEVIPVRTRKVVQKQLSKVEICQQRNDLYNGQINENDLKLLAETNSATIEGCIFIAEVCKYFKLEQLGIQCLKGIKRKNVNINNNEKIAISKAEELLKNKNWIIPNKEKWNNIYKILNRMVEVSDSKGR